MGKGLSCRFNLEKGRFSLTEGKEKTRDNIWFYCIFDKFRVYTSDFGSNFLTLVQKPAAYLLANKTIILGPLKKGIQKYVPNVQVAHIDVGYTSKDRKNHTVKIEYVSTQENNVVTQDVMFV